MVLSPYLALTLTYSRRAKRLRERIRVRYGCPKPISSHWALATSAIVSTNSGLPTVDASYTGAEVYPDPS
jgi:hypothetical protein